MADKAPPAGAAMVEVAGYTHVVYADTIHHVIDVIDHQIDTGGTEPITHGGEKGQLGFTIGDFPV